MLSSDSNLVRVTFNKTTKVSKSLSGASACIVIRGTTVKLDVASCSAGHGSHRYCGSRCLGYACQSACIRENKDCNSSVCDIRGTNDPRYKSNIHITHNIYTLYWQRYRR